jgi:hypothetical protein
MMVKTVTVPELALLAGTRVAGGAGLGLLLADRLGRRQRRAVGLTLLAVGALTTIPLVAGIVRRDRAGAGGRPAAPTDGGGARSEVASGPGWGI